MGRITLKQAAAWCGGTVAEKYENIEFFGANNDTRTLQPGQLFVVLQGARDGHDFIPAAMEKGAAAVLCSRTVGDYPAIVVEDTRIALGKIAAAERQRINPKVVGITGSVGKSTTKEMVAAVLATTYRVGKTPVNHNNDIGMPMAILGMADDIQAAVLEMGMNHFREIAYLSNIGKPDLAAIMNIGTVHIEYLGSQAGIRQAKMEILEGMTREGKLYLNGDDAMLQSPGVPIAQEVVYFGTNEGCNLRATRIETGEGSLRFQVTGSNVSFPVELSLEGGHYVTDALAAVAIGLELGVTPENIRLGLAGFRNLSGRQEMMQVNGITLIKDCYNASPESMTAALKVLGARTGRRIAVMGDMLELGSCASAEHYRVGRVAAENADIVYAYGPNAEKVVSGCLTGGMEPKTTRCFEDRNGMAAALNRIARPGDVILFKASHGIHLEEVLDAFLKAQNRK